MAHDDRLATTVADLPLGGIDHLFAVVDRIPLAYWIAYTRTRFKPLFETLVSMPLVLPPSVLGFYLLLAFSPQHAFGAWLQQWFHIQLAFSFPGLVVASILFSLPFISELLFKFILIFLDLKERRMNILFREFILLVYILVQICCFYF